MTDAADGDDADRPTMADVDHTHPETGQAFGTVYRRGPVVADGEGPAVARDPDPDPDPDPGDGNGAEPGAGAGAGAGEARVEGSTRDRMDDVTHEAPHDDGARGVWTRGESRGGRGAGGAAGAGEAGTERGERAATQVSEVSEGPDDE